MPDYTDKYSIGIIGGGMVGSAAKQYYKNARVFDLDPKRATHSFEEVCEQDYIFVSVPTPMGEGGKINLTAVEETISRFLAVRRLF